MHHSHSRDNGRWYRLSQRNGGIIKTVRLALAGLCLLLSSSPRWGADECRLMILGVGGICQKSYLLLLPPSNVVGVSPPGLRRLGHLLSIWFFLPRLLTPRQVNPRVEWMLSFLWVLFGSFWRLHALPTFVVDLRWRWSEVSLPQSPDRRQQPVLTFVLICDGAGRR